ncbi:MAG: FAD-dependent oxidoreductase, partial [Candidatus Omnitrophica bacterium]|nr:FAD-dependent oxidoreductase [Candidatus Omnitrophota bacterium]
RDASQIIPTEDEEIAQVLAKEMSKKGIIIKTGAKVENISVGGNGVKIKASSGEEVSVEKVLVAVGRSPNIEGMGFEEAGIKIENNKIAVNNCLETNIPGVFAIGDITQGPLLAHKASSQAITAAVNAAGGSEEFLMGDIIPSCIYSFPEVARVGLTEKEAKDEGYKINVGKFPFRNLGKAQAISQTEGMAKVIVNSETKEVLGVHIIGPHATELIGEVSLAKRMEATSEDIATTCHPHPTFSEVLMEACHAVYGQAIHLA